MSAPSWTPDAFRAYPIAQQPTYDDPVAVEITATAGDHVVEVPRTAATATRARTSGSTGWSTWTS